MGHHFGPLDRVTKQGVLKMGGKKRILFVTDTFGYGGAEKQLAFVAEGLIARGLNVGICNLNIRGEHEGQRAIDSRVEMFVSDIAYRNTILSNYDFSAFIFKTAKTFHADLIVGFKQLGCYAVLVGKLLHIPAIISERADPYRAYENANFPLRIKLWLTNHAAGGVFQTAAAQLFYSKKLQEKGVVIPNPIFVPKALPEIDYSLRPKTVVSLGRIDNHQKRLDVMLDAFSIFHSSHPDYLLKIYGNGEDEDLIKQWIIEKGLSQCVMMMGVSHNSLNDLSKEGIFLITSDFEGISNSLLEAMACGLPVVSTDHTPGGARMLINDGENGLLTPIGDVDALARSLALFADDSKLAESCGRNAKEVLIRFAPSHILDMWEEYLLGMLR